MEVVWFEQSPYKLNTSIDETTQLDTIDSFDIFLQLYLHQMGQVFIASDYYNYYDLNRVEINTQVVEDLINTYSSINLLSKNISRDMTAIEFYDSLNRVESNILALKNVTFEPIGWETPKTNWASIDAFSFADANRLEANLWRLYQMCYKTKEYLLYCGSPNAICGNDNTIL